MDDEKLKVWNLYNKEETYRVRDGEVTEEEEDPSVGGKGVCCLV